GHVFAAVNVQGNRAEGVDGFGAHLVTTGNILKADQTHEEKSEIRNPKSEGAPKRQARHSRRLAVRSLCKIASRGDVNAALRTRGSGRLFCCFSIRISSLFRTSDFELRVSVPLHFFSLSLSLSTAPFLIFFLSSSSRLMAL